jgi:hypothetical protein
MLTRANSYGKLRARERDTVFSLSDFAEPGDSFRNFITGESFTVPDADDDGRFWIHDSVVEDQPDTGMPFGDATVGIVDEDAGGVIVYVHESNAPVILQALRASMVDSQHENV